MSKEELYSHFQNSTGVCTDTRKINKGCLFYALKGDNFNGNEFAQKAIDEGAAFSIIDEEKYNTSSQHILVNDVLECLQKLAKTHRNNFDIPVIALTGSNGKTTSKELLKAVLSQKYIVHATVGNLNNHIGVPLTLLKMPKNTEIAVIEMGANHQKEIALLCDIANPNFGLITNIGKAHLEGFGGLAGIIKGKGELFDYLEIHEGLAFMNEKDNTIVSMAKAYPKMSVNYFGDELSLIEDSPKIKWKELNKEAEYISHLSGAYNFNNLHASYVIGTYFGVLSVDINHALENYKPDNNRSQSIQKGTNNIYLDAYNANPSSMEAALKNFQNIASKKPKVVLLGDMFELGEDSPKEHELLGELVSKGKYETVVLFGKDMKFALKYLPKAYYFTDKFSLHNWVLDKNFMNKEILIKGSRGVSLETILKFI